MEIELKVVDNNNEKLNHVEEELREYKEENKKLKFEKSRLENQLLNHANEKNLLDKYVNDHENVMNNSKRLEISNIKLKNKYEIKQIESELLNQEIELLKENIATIENNINNNNNNDVNKLREQLSLKELELRQVVSKTKEYENSLNKTQIELYESQQQARLYQSQIEFVKQKKLGLSVSIPCLISRTTNWETKTKKNKNKITTANSYKSLLICCEKM